MELIFQKAAVTRLEEFIGTVARFSHGIVLAITIIQGIRSLR